MAIGIRVSDALRCVPAFVINILSDIRDILKMKLRKKWFHTAASKTSALWSLSSHVVCILASSFSKVWLEKFNRTVVYNGQQFLSLLEKRSDGRGLVTVSNHFACMDDPLIWGIRGWKHVVNNKYLRWIPSADEICFTNYMSAVFFSLGRCVPVVRGDGVHQRGMDFCLDKLNQGEWVHMFPEGKVNKEKEVIRLKWGVGRLVAECDDAPIVLPMFHVGLDEILPNKKPYIPQVGKDVTIVVGEPVDYTEVLVKLRNLNTNLTDQRKFITDDIEERLYKLQKRAEEIHTERLSQRT